jgi:hypothetical protein
VSEANPNVTAEFLMPNVGVRYAHPNLRLSALNDGVVIHARSRIPPPPNLSCPPLVSERRADKRSAIRQSITRRVAPQTFNSVCRSRGKSKRLAEDASLFRPTHSSNFTSHNPNVTASVGWALLRAAHHWPWNGIGRGWAALTLGPPYGLLGE